MNVLYLVRTWPLLHGDYIFREVAWMKLHGHGLAIAATESLPDEYNGRELLSQYGLESVPELLLEDDPDPFERLLAFANRHRIELIDAHDGRGPAEIALEIFDRAAIPFTVRFQGGDVHSSPSPRIREISAAARALCPISRFLAEILTGARIGCRRPPHMPVDVDRDRLRICPHGMPADVIAREPPRHRDGELQIGTISRLDDAEKCGALDLVRAFAVIAEAYPKAKMRFIGGGAMQPEIESLACELRVGERVTVTGFVPWQEAMRLGSQLAIFVHGGEAEGFCLPVLEAAACGLPLAVTRTGVSEEIVEDGVNGFLFDYGDSTALAQRLRQLLAGGAESRRRMGLASIARVRDRFVFETIMARTENILCAAAEGAPLPS